MSRHIYTLKKIDLKQFKEDPETGVPTMSYTEEGGDGDGEGLLDLKSTFDLDNDDDTISVSNKQKVLNFFKEFGINLRGGNPGKPWGGDGWIFTDPERHIVVEQTGEDGELVKLTDTIKGKQYIGKTQVQGKTLRPTR